MSDKKMIHYIRAGVKPAVRELFFNNIHKSSEKINYEITRKIGK